VCEFIEQGTVPQNNEICSRYTAGIWVSKNILILMVGDGCLKISLFLFHVVTVVYDGGSHFYFENILSSLQCVIILTISFE
jgi:hypothetical protein